MLLVGLVVGVKAADSVYFEEQQKDNEKCRKRYITPRLDVWGKPAVQNKCLSISFTPGPASVFSLNFHFKRQHLKCCSHFLTCKEHSTNPLSPSDKWRIQNIDQRRWLVSSSSSARELCATGPVLVNFLLLHHLLEKLFRQSEEGQQPRFDRGTPRFVCVVWSRKPFSGNCEEQQQRVGKASFTSLLTRTVPGLCVISCHHNQVHAESTVSPW